MVEISWHMIAAAGRPQALGLVNMLCTCKVGLSVLQPPNCSNEGTSQSSCRGQCAWPQLFIILQVSLASGSGARRLAEARCRANIQLLLVQVNSLPTLTSLARVWSTAYACEFNILSAGSPIAAFSSTVSELLVCLHDFAM